MKTKGIAVQTIIMIMLGVVVLLFVGYWLVRSFTTPALSQEQCKALYMTWCRSCALTGWTNANLNWNPSGTTVTDCLGKYASSMGFSTITANYDCTNTNNKNNCALVGVTL